MEDISKIKPYISYLNKQLEQLAIEIKKLTAQSLNEQLLSLKDEREKLALSNKYAYVLSSLLFVYMKVLNVKDMSPIMGELARVKSYMDRAKQLDKKEIEKQQKQKEQQASAKAIIQSSLNGADPQPAISKVHFQGRHTKFEDSGDKEEMAKKIMSRLKQAKSTKGKVSKKK
ncbi:HCL390Wp [Eremothecium sinecaudum]|uniref:Exosome complex protein n=1 Tax=Eremothecium sinecaudum TaxID=45286 RepID=A0A109UWB9_9SACH|nr:HCL390Wp [Eremothecium sinecaudum]AMD19761.1 HCL390Wp [Eremothecium sinecaudum]